MSAKFDPEDFILKIQAAEDVFRATHRKDREEIERDKAEARAAVIKSWNKESDE